MKDKTLKQLVESIKASSQPKTSAYDTSATVTRIENGVAWVHIPGGVRETPVKLTIAAKAGDNVQVRVSGGRAFMVGNATAPPTDDRVATQALTETKTINKVVKAVQAAADKAARVAGNTNQYFWHTSTGSDTGAHITEIPQEDFLEDPANGGGNLLARSNGVAIRNGLNELAQFTSNMVLFNDEDGNRVSSFGASGTRIGKNGNANLELNNLGFVGFDENNYEVFRLQFANASGIAEITEHGDSVVNTNVDMQTFQDFTAYLSNTPVQNTQIYHVIHAFIDFNGRDATCHLQTTPRTYNRDSSSSRQTVPYRIEVISGNNIAYLSLSERYVEYSPDSSFVDITTSHSAAKILAIQVDTILSVDASTVPSYTFGTRTDARTRYGGYSFTSGRNNSATGNDAVAMGKDNVASGEWSHVAGAGNTASGMWSFAEGNGNAASGARSHAAGGDTTASSNDQFVIGRRNIDDPNDQYAFIIGNGDYAEETNSNALTVDWAGNVAMSGDLTASNVGAVYSNTADAAISSTNIDTYAVGASVTVPAGVYVITAYWTFQSVSGARICDIDISTTGGTTATGYIARQRVSNATGNWSRLNVTTIESFASETTLYVKGSSTVAYTSAAPTRIMAVRIK